MPRSLKKGPFVQPRLLDRVRKMNEAGEIGFVVLGMALVVLASAMVMAAHRGAPEEQAAEIG